MSSPWLATCLLAGLPFGLPPGLLSGYQHLTSSLCPCLSPTFPSMPASIETWTPVRLLMARLARNFRAPDWCGCKGIEPLPLNPWNMARLEMKIHLPSNPSDPRDHSSNPSDPRDHLLVDGSGYISLPRPLDRARVSNFSPQVWFLAFFGGFLGAHISHPWRIQVDISVKLDHLPSKRWT